MSVDERGGNISTHVYDFRCENCSQKSCGNQSNRFLCKTDAGLRIKCELDLGEERPGDDEGGAGAEGLEGDLRGRCDARGGEHSAERHEALLQGLGVWV